VGGKKKRKEGAPFGVPHNNATIYLVGTQLIASLL